MRQLVVDVGNTETVLGIVEGRDRLLSSWRVSTATPRTADEYTHLLRGMVRESGYDPEALDGAVLGSVVPASTDVLVPTLDRMVGGAVVLVDALSKLPITLDVDEPMTVGADRIVNTLAARELYGRNTLAVDLGTATTYDCITADGRFVGGVIAPGVSAGLEWLSRRTAKLPKVGFTAPPTVVGRRTEVCIQSGIFFAVIDALDGMVARILAEWEVDDPLVVATGGYATAVGEQSTSVEKIEPWLTLYGLAIAGEMLR